MSTAKASNELAFFHLDIENEIFFPYEYTNSLMSSWRREKIDNGNNGGSGDSNRDEGGGNQNNNGKRFRSFRGS
jgi:hypothetical protein